MMKTVKLSPFAESNISALSEPQRRAVRDAIVLLGADGLHQAALKVLKLPSGQAYVVDTKKGARLTVQHSGGGHLLVDDVFVPEPKTTTPSGAVERSTTVRGAKAASKPRRPSYVPLPSASGWYRASGAHATPAAAKKAAKKA